MPIPSEGDLTLRHVAVDGPIGVGKTSLCDMLARRFHGTKILEDVPCDDLPEVLERVIPYVSKKRHVAARAERVGSERISPDAAQLASSSGPRSS